MPTDVQRRKGQQDKQNSVDSLYLKLTRYLARDFQTLFEDPTLYQDIVCCSINRDISGLRANKPVLSYDVPPIRFKADYQMGCIDKRYRYRQDTYSDDELQNNAIAKFMDVQNRLAGIDWKVLLQDERMQRILSLARKCVGRILGPMPDDEIRRLAQFGNGASVGVKAREAHLAQRYSIPITGTKEQISWWRSEYDQCPHFQQWLVTEYGITDVSDSRIYKEIDTLALTFVPKNHKSLRAILPNTTIGTYQSCGIGEVIRERLMRRVDLDVRKLQHIHRRAAQVASMDQRHLTMDLQSASDSISGELLEILLPSSWWNLLSNSRADNISLPNGTVVQSNTFCTMGIGYTFTLQTLVFYSLIWACQAVTDRFLRPTFISVYGDDLIFGSHLNEIVRETFNQLGICVNEEKTFTTVPFRESCGGDYYHGWDVRPFQPEMTENFVSNMEYEALLYKCINGLLMRWDEHTIGGTLRFLAAEVEKVSLACKLVPLDYPENSGIRVARRVGCACSDYWEFLRFAKVVKPVHVGHGVMRFVFLKLELKEKEELRHGPYYWSAIRGRSLVRADQHYQADSPTRTHATLVLIQESARLKTLAKREGEPVLIYRQERPSDLRYSPHEQCGDAALTDFVGPVSKRRSTFVRITHTGVYRRKKGTSCFDDRS